MKTPPISYEVLQLRPNQILLYTYYPDARRGRSKDSDIEYTPAMKAYIDSLNQDEPNKKYTGYLSESAKRKLRYSINLLVAQSTWKEAFNYDLQKTFRFRVNFITLTLSAPQKAISDKEIKRVCLNNFLNRARKKHGMNTYVWRAEKQKNGNIHFHITTDVYIHYRELCDLWNECQELLGFVSRFRERTGSYRPNSTDIHSVKNIKELAAYMVKYMSKDTEDGQQIEGKVWGCSRNLSQAKRFETELYGIHYDKYKQLISDYPDAVFKNDYCEIITLPEKIFLKEISPVWGKEYAKYLAQVRSKHLSQ